MIEVVQLCYIFTILIAISAFSLQYLARRKNLAVTNQYIKGRMATLFLALILLFNVCDFLLLFLGTALDIASTDWIYVVENVLEVALAYVLMGMERDHLSIEERKGTATFFAVIAAVIFWTDTTYTAGIMITSETVYTAVMVVLNLLPVLAVAVFSVRSRQRLMAVSRQGLTEGYFVIYNLVFMFLCVVATVSILDSRTTVDYVGNDKEIYVVFWFLFNLLNFFLVWRSCRTVEELKQAEIETPEDTLNRLAENYHLSQREKEIAGLICKGKNNNDIAADLFLSPNTVKVHTSNLYKKLGVKNRVQAVQILRSGTLEK